MTNCTKKVEYKKMIVLKNTYTDNRAQGMSLRAQGTQ